MARKIGMKKGRNAWFRPFFTVLTPSDAVAPSLPVVPASVISTRLGVVDRCLMIPALAATGGFDLRGKLERCARFAITTSAESSTATGRELIDLGRPLV
jgi:hypothetical protein